MKISVHPEIKNHVSFFEGVQAFLDGSVAKVSDYLIKYDSESSDTPEASRAWAGRKRRLYNKNWVKPFHSLHLGHLSQEMTLNVGDEDVWTAILENADRKGKSFKTLSREYLADYLSNGLVGVLVDGPARTASTLAEAQANNERSWQVKYSALDVVNWKRFATGPLMGELQEVVLREGTVKIDDKEHERLRRFYREGDSVAYQILVAQNEIKGEGNPFKDEREFDVVEEGVLPLTYIPFVFFGEGPESSVVGSLWELNAAIMNRSSVRSNIVYNQGFQRVVFFGVKREEVSNIGEWLGTIIGNDKARVEEIPAGDPVAVVDELASLESFCTRIGKMEWNQLADDSKQTQSADSKRLDTIGRRKLYDFILDHFEHGIMKLMQFHADYEGLGDARIAEITVRIERDYGLEDEQAEALEREQAFNMAERLGVVELQKELLKVAISKITFVPRDDASPEDVKKLMMEAIDAAQGKQPGSGLADIFGRVQERFAA